MRIPIPADEDRYLRLFAGRTSYIYAHPFDMAFISRMRKDYAGWCEAQLKSNAIERESEEG